MDARVRVALGAFGMTAAFLIAGCGDGRGEGGPIRVFAAASLAPVLQELERDGILGGRGVRYSFAASSTIARQIDAGAPADVVVSANSEWIEWLERRGKLREGSRRSGPANELVLIAPRDRGFTWRPGERLAVRAGGRVALADPAHVPAGRYAKQALTNAGQWGHLEPHVVATGDVRAALAMVERGECDVGIVYRSDALASARVEIVAGIPTDWHDPVTYVAAGTLHGRAAAAAAWIDGLHSAAAHERLVARGFRIIGGCE